MADEPINLLGYWMSLSLVFKTFIIYFCFVIIHTLYVSLRALLLLRTENKSEGTGDSFSRFGHLGLLEKRIANLRQIHLFTFYLFGLCISMQFPNAFTTLDSSKSFHFSAITGQMTLLFYWSSGIFFAFLLLHALQWFVSERLQQLRQ